MVRGGPPLAGSCRTAGQRGRRRPAAPGQGRDQGSYSDLIFGIVALLGFDYRPVLADVPDTKLWPIDATADHGYLDRTARGRSDLCKIAWHWPDILRVIASIHAREISAHDAVRVL